MFKQTSIQRKLIIPTGISAKAIQYKQDALLAFALLYKSMYEGGCIKNHQKRYGEIAKRFGCTKKTVRKYTTKLIETGLAKTSDGILWLVSKDKLCRFFGIEFNYYLKYSYKQTEYKDLKNYLRVLALNDNLHKQRKVKESILVKGLEANNYGKETTKKIIKKERVVNSKSFNSFGDNITLSQRGISKVFGNSSCSSGSYWSRKLQRLNKLEVKHQTAKVYMMDISREAFRQIRNAMPELPLIYAKTKCTAYVLQPNLIKPIL